MKKLSKGDRPESDHISANNLMCELLTKLGYGEGIEIFEEINKWYSWKGEINGQN